MVSPPEKWEFLFLMIAAPWGIWGAGGMVTVCPLRVRWAETAYALRAVISIQPLKCIQRTLLGLYRLIHARHSSLLTGRLSGTGK